MYQRQNHHSFQQQTHNSNFRSMIPALPAVATVPEYSSCYANYKVFNDDGSLPNGHSVFKLQSPIKPFNSVAKRLQSHPCDYFGPIQHRQEPSPSTHASVFRLFLTQNSATGLGNPSPTGLNMANSTSRPLMQSYTSIIYPTNVQTSKHASARTLTAADERERARKVSHSAIERRRRERINDKITRLKYLIPGCIDRGNLHKLDILQSAINYIEYLQGLVGDENGSNRFAKRAKFEYEDSLASVTRRGGWSLSTAITTATFERQSSTLDAETTPRVTPLTNVKEDNRNANKHVAVIGKVGDVLDLERPETDQERNAQMDLETHPTPRRRMTIQDLLC